VDFDDTIRFVFINEKDWFRLFSFSAAGLKFSLNTLVFFLSFSFEGSFTIFASLEMTIGFEIDFEGYLAFIAFDKS
jgi:hypothetical protein